MGAPLSLVEFEGSTAPDHVLPVLQEVTYDLRQRENLGTAGDNRQHDDPKGGLQRGQLEERVQHDLRLLAALQFNHDAHAATIALVAQIADPLDLFLNHELSNLLYQTSFVHLIGQLVDNNRFAVFPKRFKAGPGPQVEDSPPGSIGREDPWRP